MKRVEIVVNQSIVGEVQDHLKSMGLMESCTRWSPVFGTGNSGPREGSAVWPETNSVILLFLPSEKVEPLRFVIEGMKRQYPQEGLKCFISEGPVEVI